MLPRGPASRPRWGVPLTASVRQCKRLRLGPLSRLFERLRLAPQSGRTALIMAAMYGTADAVRLLLDRGASIEATDDVSRSAGASADTYWHIRTGARALALVRWLGGTVRRNRPLSQRRPTAMQSCWDRVCSLAAGPGRNGCLQR